MRKIFLTSCLMTEIQPVVFMDSGIGGLLYLTHIQSRLANRRLIYLADNKYFPYGEKDPGELTRHFVSLACFIEEKFNPALIVIACNTASVTSLSEVRKKVSSPVVGVVPAVKPAAVISEKGIAILATENTIKTPYLQNLIESFAAKKNVNKIIAGDLVRFIEEKMAISDQAELEKLLEKYIESINSCNVDSLVLGCTHFTHLESVLKKMLNPGLQIVDSREGVSKRILYLLKQSYTENLHEVDLNEKHAPGFYCTSESLISENYRLMFDRHGFVFKGDLYV